MEWMIAIDPGYFTGLILAQVDVKRSVAIIHQNQTVEFELMLSKISDWMELFDVKIILMERAPKFLMRNSEEQIAIDYWLKHIKKFPGQIEYLDPSTWKPIFKSRGKIFAVPKLLSKHEQDAVRMLAVWLFRSSSLAPSVEVFQRRES